MNIVQKHVQPVTEKNKRCISAMQDMDGEVGYVPNGPKSQNTKPAVYSKPSQKLSENLYIISN